MGSLDTVQKALADEGFLATRLDAFVNWGRKNSLWPMPLGLSCCGIEMMAMVGPRYDIARFGAEALRFSPRQADLLIVAGTLTWKMAEVARTIYDQMPDPKWVISMGVCASTGGMYDTYSVVQGVDMILPVDIYVPGCPPRPDAVIDGLMKLQKQIELERPIKSLLSDRSAENEWMEGSGNLSHQENQAVSQFDPSTGVASDGEH
ncbi:MAG: NADH-quinone oxidoreductase subunit B [Planctomycetota bacterium]|jgi:NADH-quinone oxidoreductase subunit B